MMEGPAAAQWSAFGGHGPPGNGYGTSRHGYPPPSPARSGELRINTSMSRANSALDMRQLSMALSDAREGTGEVRSILLKASFRPRLPGLTKIVSKLSKEGCWRKALEVYETVEEMGLAPDTALTNAAISACDKGGRWQKALELFDRMERLHLPRDAITYSATISALSKGKQWAQAIQVFDHMQASHVEADVVACCSLINALERGGQWQLAEKLFLQMCTVQDDGQASMPKFSANGKLMRAHSSPTSVMANLPPRESPPLTTIGEESGRSPSGKPPLPPARFPSSGWDEGQLASLGILRAASQSPSPGAAAAALMRQPSGGSTLEGAAEGSRTPGERAAAAAVGPEELAAALEKGLTLGPSGGASLERQPSTDLTNPFSVASKMGLGLCQTPSGSSLDQLGLAAASAPGLQRAGTLPRAFSQLSSQIPEDEVVLEPVGRALSLPSAAAARAGGAASPSAASSNASAQVAAAHHLHRAMTVACCNDLDMTPEQKADSGLTSMFNFSHAAKVAPNRVCCNALLAAYARAKPPQWHKALHLLEAMWGGGPMLAPDTVSYNTALKACANSFQLGKAIELYKDMVRRGVRPNVTTFNTLIAAASDAGNYTVLHEVAEWMDTSADAEIRAPCLNVLVLGLVKVGHWDEALLRFHAMLSPSSSVRPTASTFNTIMTGYMKQGQYDKVRELFEDMVASGLSPSVVTFNTLLSAQANLGAWEEALATLNRVLAAQLEGVTPNTTTFNTVLAALAKGAGSAPPHQHSYLATSALQVYQQMQGGAGGATPDITTFTSLVKILDTTHHPQQVLAIHEVMMSQGHTPDAPTATTILNAAAQLGQVQKAACLAHSLASQGIMVDPALHAALLSACVATGAWEQASLLCSAALAVQGSCPATAAIFNSVLHSALPAGQFGVIVELLQLMKAANLEVDPAVSSMILGSQPGTPVSPAMSPFGQAPGSMFTSHSPVPPPTPPAATVAPMRNPFGGWGCGVPAVSSFPASPHNAAPPRLPSQGLPSSPFTPRPPSQLPPPHPGPPGTYSPHAPAALPPPPPQPQLRLGSPAPGFASLEDATRLLAQLNESGDLQSALEVLAGLKQAGITPGKAAYTHLIQLAVRCQQPHLAVQLCCEGHDACALHHYALPDLATKPTLPGAALGNVVDLRGCKVEVGVAVLLTWLTRAAQLQPAGLVVKDRSIKVVTGQRQGAADGGASPGGQQQQQGESSLASALCHMLTTSTSPVPAFCGLVPLALPAAAVSLNDDAGIIEVQTPALYKALLGQAD